MQLTDGSVLLQTLWPILLRRAKHGFFPSSLVFETRELWELRSLPCLVVPVRLLHCKEGHRMRSRVACRDRSAPGYLLIRAGILGFGSPSCAKTFVSRAHYFRVINADFRPGLCNVRGIDCRELSYQE